MNNIKVEKLAFQGVQRGFLFQAWYLIEPKGDALVQIWTEGKFKEFLFPAYKIWNIPAHANDIIDSELAGDLEGYRKAAWTGFPNQFVN